MTYHLLSKIRQKTSAITQGARTNQQAHQNTTNYSPDEHLFRSFESYKVETAPGQYSQSIPVQTQGDFELKVLFDDILDDEELRRDQTNRKNTAIALMGALVDLSRNEVYDQYRFYLNNYMNVKMEGNEEKILELKREFIDYLPKIAPACRRTSRVQIGSETVTKEQYITRKCYDWILGNINAQQTEQILINIVNDLADDIENIAGNLSHRPRPRNIFLGV